MTVEQTEQKLSKLQKVDPEKEALIFNKLDKYWTFVLSRFSCWISSRSYIFVKSCFFEQHRLPALHFLFMYSCFCTFCGDIFSA